MIPIPGDRHCPGPAGRLFFATRQAAEDDLYRGERERAGQAEPQAPPIRELRRAMADAHPDRGGTADQFIQARRRYQMALRSATVTCPPTLPPADATAPRDEQMTVPGHGMPRSPGKTMMPRACGQHRPPRADNGEGELKLYGVAV